MRKKRLLLASVLLLSCCAAMAWGGKGHQIVAEIARRQLVPKAGSRLAQLFPEGFVAEASWADEHRKDAEYLFTDAYHTMAMNHDYVYDPGWRMWKGGDCVTCLQWIDYSLSHQEELHLSDSVKIFQVRMLVHVVGDMHCLGHAYIMPEENHWDCTFKGETTTYHKVVDNAPKTIYGGAYVETIAASLDTFSEDGKANCCKGPFIDWAQECCERDKILYDVNPLNTAELNSKTIERITPAVEESLRVSGYRLGYLLNKYFNY